jgi:hypothetical protein
MRALDAIDEEFSQRYHRRRLLLLLLLSFFFFFFFRISNHRGNNSAVLSRITSVSSRFFLRRRRRQGDVRDGLKSSAEMLKTCARYRRPGSGELHVVFEAKMGAPQRRKNHLI